MKNKQNIQINFNQKFLDVFTAEELENISNHAAAIGSNYIVIITEKNFFELSVDIGDELDIYCGDNNTNEGKRLTKSEFIKLYKSSPVAELNVLTIDE